MGLSINKFTYTGYDTFELNFALGYASRGDVSCYKEGPTPIDVEFDWITDSTVRVYSADLSVGDELVFRRTVSKVSLPVDLTQPSQLTRESVQTAVLHSLYAFHELIDGRFGDLVEVTDAVYGLVEEAVTVALSNFLFYSDFKQDWVMYPETTGVNTVHWNSGGFMGDTSETIVEVVTNPSEEFEFMLTASGVVVYAATVSSNGTVSPTTTTEFVSEPGPVTFSVVGNSYSTGAELVVVMPVKHRAVVDFDAVLSDYVDIFEQARTT